MRLGRKRSPGESLTDEALPITLLENQQISINNNTSDPEDLVNSRIARRMGASARLLRTPTIRCAILNKVLLHQPVISF
jgi:hypothetical protein